MRMPTVVLPVPGGPVKHMCRLGRVASRPNRPRTRSTSSSAAISSIRFLTGTSPTSSVSSAASTSSIPAASRSCAKLTLASAGSGSCGRADFPNLRGRADLAGPDQDCWAALTPRTVEY